MSAEKQYVEMERRELPADFHEGVRKKYSIRFYATIGGVIGAFVIVALIITVSVIATKSLKGNSPTAPDATSPDSTSSAQPVSLQVQLASVHMGTSCNIINGAGCNPYQLYGTQPSSTGYTAGLKIVGVSSSVANGGISGISATAGIEITPIDEISQTADSEIITTISDFSSSRANSFGISFGLPPIDGIAFGASAAYKTTFQTLFDTTTQQYVAHSKVVYAKYEASFNPNYVLKADTALQQAINSLPSTLGPKPWSSTSGNLQQYYNFFMTYGTHYVSSAVYGGMKHASQTIDASLVSQGTLSRNDIECGLTVKLASIVNLSPSYTNAWSQSQISSVSSYFTGANVKSYGGNPGISDLSAWVASFTDSNAVPIHTTLSLITDVFPSGSKYTAEAALKAIMQMCPSASTSPNSGNLTETLCSGQGICNFKTGSCDCIAGKRGVACSTFDCSQNCGGPGVGYCEKSTGLCKCLPSSGRTGCNCETSCGYQSFNPPKYNGGYMDHCLSNGGSSCNGGGAACACNNLISGSTVLGYGTGQTQNTYYPCGGGGCNAHLFWHCSYIQWLDCLPPGNVQSCAPTVGCTPNSN